MSTEQTANTKQAAAAEQTPTSEELELYTQELEHKGVSTELLTQLRAAARLVKSIEQARVSPLGLYKLCFSADDRSAVIIKPFHQLWNDMLVKNQFNLIEAPRGSTKSSFLMADAAWEVGQNLNIRIKLLGSDDNEASKRLKVVRQIIAESELYHRTFPLVVLDKKLRNDATQLHVVRDARVADPTIEAVGILSSGTGGRCDLLLLDDVVSYRNAILNPSMRPQVVEKFRGDWLPIIEPKRGRACSIFTPWTEDDLNAMLKQSSTWTYSRIAHGVPGDPYYSILPELFPREKLMQLRRDEGELHYSRARLCNALSKDTILVLPEHLRPYTAATLTLDKLARARVFVSLDPASGKEASKGKLDYFSPSVHVFVPDYETGRYEIFVTVAFQARIPPRAQVAVAEQLYLQWQPELVICEAQGMQALHELIYTSSIIPPEKVLPIPAPLSKGERLSSVTPMLDPPEGEPPNVYFHPDVVASDQPTSVLSLPDGYRFEARCTLRSQILNFPSRHDDVMDSVVQGLRHILQVVLPEFRSQTGPTAPAGLVIQTINTNPLPLAEHERSSGKRKRREKYEPSEAEVLECFNDLPGWLKDYVEEDLQHTAPGPQLSELTTGKPVTY